MDVQSQLQQLDETGMLRLAKAEMERMTTHFNNLCAMCFMKCAEKMDKAELTVRENACVDRCTLKYMESQDLVALRVQRSNEAKQAQMMAEQQLKDSYGSLKTEVTGL